MSQYFDNPWRPTYEVVACAGWSAAALLLAVCACLSALPALPLLYTIVICLGFAAWRARQAWENWTIKAALSGRALPVIHPKALQRLTLDHPADMWLGKGFDWKPVHTQRVYDVRKHDLKDLEPPEFFLNYRQRLMGAPAKSDVGAAWLHGLEPEEGDLWMPLANLAGNTLVVGTTGAGKTRLFDLLISQAVFRNDIVVIVDPKGDIDLREMTRDACARAGRPDDFVFFHPAFPQQSCRLDPLKNWNMPTELASRVAALVPSETGADAFTAFSWLTINNIVSGLIYIEERPNLKRLREHIIGGPEMLLERVMEAYFKKHFERWESMAAPYIDKAPGERKANRNIPATASNRLLGMIGLYQQEAMHIHRSEAVDSLLSMFFHSREHLSKMLASLIPVLQMLVAGSIGELLSPEVGDVDDPRPVYDTEKIINTNKVLYVGLDSLSNSTVGSAIGSVLLADLASVAGARYNFGKDDKRICLFVDECAEVVNPPFIQILNKARGAGFNAVFATQTIADFEARLGSEAKARQLLGNANNLIALRTRDRTTQEFVTETFGKVAIKEFRLAQSTGSGAADNIGTFSGSVSQGRVEKEVEVFPPELLGMLPNLQYMASISGGRLIKGRLPLVLEKS